MSMRDELARAIDPDAGWPSNGARPAYTLESRVAKAYARADAVLAVLREPTSYMVDMGCVKWLRPVPGADDPRLFGEKIIDVWHGMIDGAASDQVGNPETQAMIDAAISEGMVGVEEER